MKEESNQTQFYKILCESSNNKNPKLAILEWDYQLSYIENNYCICGMPIKENCLITNKLNGRSLIVGNICVNKFLDYDYSFIFKGINSINKDKMPNKTFINYCFDKGYIYEKQKDFLLKIHRKRKLTEKQKEFKFKILYKLKLRKNY